MRKRIVCLLALFLFMLSNAAFASNWVLVQRVPGNPAYSDYIDSETVDKNGSTLYYWNSGIFDTPAINGGKKYIVKNEVNLASNPIMWRTIESYSYDSNNQKITRQLIPGNWFEAKAGGYAYKEINIVLSYIKGSQTKPTPP